jgi:hypothetical protein
LITPVPFFFWKQNKENNSFFFFHWYTQAILKRSTKLTTVPLIVLQIKSYCETKYAWVFKQDLYIILFTCPYLFILQVLHYYVFLLAIFMGHTSLCKLSVLPWLYLWLYYPHTPFYLAIVALFCGVECCKGLVHVYNCFLLFYFK